jgi:hypothetical protein
VIWQQNAIRYHPDLEILEIFFNSNKKMHSQKIQKFYPRISIQMRDSTSHSKPVSSIISLLHAC